LDERERRVGENETIFRDVNERLRDVSQAVGGDDELDLFCECGDASCVVRLTMPLDEYEQMRANPARFVITPGHEMPAVESVVDSKEGYRIVEKHVGEPAELASERDPRS
jgi:hypothetical protein